jgi:hypothetical protein
MATHATRRLTAFVFGFLVAAGRAGADDMERLRTDSTYLQTIIAETVHRSPTLRSIIREIDASNVIVHVTCAHMKRTTLEGRTLWVSASPEVRYLRVQVDCMLPRFELAAIVGHELQHVAEVARANGVVDQRSFGRLFSVIGFSTCRTEEQFETDGAILAGERVRQEYVDWREARPKLTAVP